MLYIEYLMAFEKGTKIPVDILDAQQGCMSKLNEVTFVDSFEIRTISRGEIITKYRF